MFAEAAVCDYLKRQIFPQMAPLPYGRVETTQLGHGKPVYLFAEQSRNLTVVGTFFEIDGVPQKEAWMLARREYLNLKNVRERYGMSGAANKVVAPLGENEKLSAMVVMEKAQGKLLDNYIAKAAHEQRHAELFEKLGHLARFLIRLHRNARPKTVSPLLPQLHLGKMLDSLSEGPLTSGLRSAIERHAARWWDRREIYERDTEVIVHGDATPSNFFFHHDAVIGIDLERMKWADRCWDLGFVAAELKHHFMWRAGDRWGAEPFIGHFLWEYATQYGNTRFFRTITRRLPLYMALGLLRIARNTWLDEWHRRSLLEEARRCLKYGL